MFRSITLSLFCAVVMSTTALAGNPLPFGMQDDFEDGSLQGWSSKATLTNEPGGPGASSRYLKITSDSNVAPGHLGAHNMEQWGGAWWNGEATMSYIANDVTALAMDLNNMGDTDLALRVMVTTRSDGRWVSTNPLNLAAVSDWQHVIFSLAESDLTQVEGSGTWQGAMSDVVRWAIRHDPIGPDSHGNSPSIDATLGIDNITAVPEPATMSLLLCGAGLLLRRKRN